MAGAERAPVLVVGAGPVGLATALALAAQGVPVRVIEAEPGLTMDQRAGSFHPPTLEMLACYGVTDEMLRAGIKVPRWQIRDRRDGVVVEWDLGVIADRTAYPFRLHLEQHRLTPILLDKLKAFPHASVQFSTRYVDATQKNDHMEVRTSKEPIHASWLIGCDGGKSPVRKTLGTEFEGFTWPERFIVIGTVCDLAEHGFTANAYIADPKEWAAVFCMPYDRATGLWRMAFPVHPGEADEEVTEESAIEARLQRVAARPARYEVPYKGMYRIHQRVAEEWRNGRIVLAGDAAHINNPIGGFGLNGGIHDAISLAEKLGKVWRGQAGEELVDLYVRQRRAANIEFIQVQSIRNKQLLEEKDHDLRNRNFDELRRIASDKKLARDFLVRSSMIWSVEHAATIT